MMINPSLKNRVKLVNQAIKTGGRLDFQGLVKQKKRWDS